MLVVIVIIVTARKRSFGKVMVSQACVIYSVPGDYLPTITGRPGPPLLGDTVNKQAVHVLLECKLIVINRVEILPCLQRSSQLLNKA